MEGQTKSDCPPLTDRFTAPPPFPGQRFGLFLLRQFDKFKEEQACETENRFKEMSGLLHEQSTTIDGLRSSLARLSKQGPRGGTRR